MNYLAPEMASQAGHGKAIDWYLVGLLLYEMIVGYPPHLANDKDALIKKVKKASVKYPRVVTKHAQSLLKSLLAKNP